MRIGVCYDLRSDYLAQGYSEEDTAEFDSEITIDAICDALAHQGWEPVKIGGIKRLTEALVKIPDAAVPSNFTARVLDAIELEAAREARARNWTLNWRALWPRPSRPAPPTWPCCRGPKPIPT